jgi:hypothetical protein
MISRRNLLMSALGVPLVPLVAFATEQPEVIKGVLKTFTPRHYIYQLVRFHNRPMDPVASFRFRKIEEDNGVSYRLASGEIFVPPFPCGQLVTNEQVESCIDEFCKSENTEIYHAYLCTTSIWSRDRCQQGFVVSDVPLKSWGVYLKNSSV